MIEERGLGPSPDSPSVVDPERPIDGRGLGSVRSPMEEDDDAALAGFAADIVFQAVLGGEDPTDDRGNFGRLRFTTRTREHRTTVGRQGMGTDARN